jgi:DNA-binding transcriptional regulator LsrR (DeoR family)
LKPDEVIALREAGAVGDILGRFFDHRGKPIIHDIIDRVISISLEHVCAIPLRIGVTAGVEKAAALLGAIRGGYLNMVVTDELTATKVLQLDTDA